MGLHNIGFYDKGNLSKQVVLFRDINTSDDAKVERISDEIMDAVDTIGTQFSERNYELLHRVLSKHNIPKEKIKELRNLIGCNLRYGTLD